MAEDIFMDYAASSSPIDSEQGQVSRIQLNIPRIGTSFDKILTERSKVSSNLRNSTTNTQETRLKILQLRKFNRHLSNVITEHRKGLNELKDVVDNLNCKLLCQKFEKHHLLDEIKTCLSSKNIFETIELEPFDSNDSLQEITDSHELMIKRLQRELAKRQELQSQLISILKKKQQTELELEKKKRKIEDLRSHLQNLIKVMAVVVMSSKPLIDACGYDLEEFHRKKMAIDDLISSSAAAKASATTKTTGPENYENNFEGLQIIYEKLISFVADKPNFKLRYFDLDDEIEGEGEGEEDDDEQEQEQQQEQQDHINHKSAYIQIKMEIEEVEPLEIFLKLYENSSKLLLSIKHEILTENSISTWLNDEARFEVVTIENSSWLLPKKLQFDQDSESFNEIFSILKESIQVRNQLQILVQENFDLLEFDKNNPNELVMLSPLEKNLKAKVSMNSVNWMSETNNENDLITNLNLIGSKYRSIIDCLQAQIAIIKQ